MAEVTAKKRGSKWEYRFEATKINGKRKQISKSGFKTKKEALTAGVKAFTEYQTAGSNIVRSEVSIADYFDLWLREYCKTNLKLSTYQSYSNSIERYVKPYIGKYKLTSVSTEVLQKLVNNMFNMGYSRKTIGKVKRMISSALNYATDTLKYIPYNPMLKVKIPSERATPEIPTRNKPHIYITQEWIEKIFERFPEGHPVFIPLLLGYKCGMRIGEAYAICWDDVDFENQTISINKQVQWNGEKKYWYFTAPKFNSVRTIEIDTELCDILKRAYIKQQEDKALYKKQYINVFMDKANNSINNIGVGVKIFPINRRENGDYISERGMQHASRIIHHKLGLKEFTFHSLRHTHATMLEESGAPIKYTQERLGHKDVKVTLQIYQHNTDGLRKTGSKVLEKMLTNNSFLIS